MTINEIIFQILFNKTNMEEEQVSENGLEFHIVGPQ